MSAERPHLRVIQGEGRGEPDPFDPDVYRPRIAAARAALANARPVPADAEQVPARPLRPRRRRIADLRSRGAGA